MLASCAVLLAAMLESARYRAVVWKSSSLAVLFHGLKSAGADATGGGGGNDVGKDMYRKDMEDRAKGMMVRLREGKGGDVRLVEVNDTRGIEAVRTRERSWTGWLGVRTRKGCP